MVVRRSTCIALLLMGCLFGVGHLACAQATVDFTFVPASPAVGAQITFTAVVVEGDPAWFVRYEWDFNQDSTYETSGQTVQFAFTTAGTKPVRMRALDDRGGYHLVTKNVVIVNNPPDACFAFTPAYPSAGEPVQFDAACSSDSDGTIVTYTWEFSDGATASGRSVRHAFAVAGTRSARLTVTDNGGATDSVMQSVPVQCTNPVADFTFTPASPTVHDEIEFQDLSTDPDGGTILSWAWTFGDGETSTLRHPHHQYANGGAYTVTLVVRDNCERTGTKMTTVTVGGPSASFTYSPANPTTSDTVQFYDGSTVVGETITSWSWVFGDGSVSSAQNPSHRFATSGTYSVRLTIGTSRGAASSASRTLTISNAPPAAVFTFTPAAPGLGQLVTFSAGGSSDPDGSLTMFEWDFDGDGITDATGTTATRTFAVVGARPVTLCVTDDKGAKSCATRVVPVQGAPPVASFTFTPAAPYTGQVVTFSASGSTDSDGTIVLYEWDLDGNGTVDATGLTVTRSYPSAGVHAVTLTVTDNDLGVDAQTRGVPVSVGGTGGDNQAPIADFTFTTEGGLPVKLNDVVTFQADGSSDADGSIVAYEWDFDRDGEFDGTGSTLTYAFHEGGARIVQLRVTDDDGAYGYKTRVVTVEFVRPSANFVWSPVQPEVGDLVQFDGSSSTAQDGTVDFYEWDFDNDGEIDATGQTANHAFAEGGSHSVTLTVTSNDGITDQITKRVPVTVNAPPVAAFEVTTREADRICGHAITFSDRSTDTDGRVTQWLWNFGDGTTSAVQTPSHTYACTSAQTYTVTLTVTDDGGKTGTAQQTLRLSPGQITVSITLPSNAQANEALPFSATVTGGTPTAWVWTFGDGGTSTAQAPTHTYASDGTYTVRVTVTLSGGAGSASDEEALTVGDAPTAPYGYPNPASRSVTFVLNLPHGATDPVLRIFDVTGKLVLEDELGDADVTYVWDLVSDGEDVPNGLYFVVVSAANDGRSWRSGIFKLLVVR